MSSDDRQPEIDIPDEFYDEFGTIEAAQQAPSSTDEDAQPRCPHCDSVNIVPKAPSSVAQPDRKAGDWRCQHCTAHFESPNPPRSDEVGEQVTLEEASR